ncbi:MAG: hypothetical protein IPM29_23095 [Planctomycetes bacterium]|nr:hypothetical protein [Planctomycetota bacterium]
MRSEDSNDAGNRWTQLLQGHACGRFLPELLRMIDPLVGAGRLVLVRPDGSLAFGIARGAFVSSWTDDPRIPEQLGELLVATGAIGRVELRRMLQRQRRDRRRLGILLAEAGSVTPVQVRDALTLQLRARVDRARGWDSLEYRLETCDDAPAALLHVSIAALAAELVAAEPKPPPPPPLLEHHLVTPRLQDRLPMPPIPDLPPALRMEEAPPPPPVEDAPTPPRPKRPLPPVPIDLFSWKQ